MLVKNVL